jgi:hypothetical protein
MSSAKPLSVAVRLPAVRARDGGCLDALRALGGIEIRRLEEADPVQPLDLILDLTSRPVEPSHLTWPRYGYWTFLYGERPERIAPGLPEILSGQRAAFVRLARLVPGGKAVILRAVSVNTDLLPPARTRPRLLEAAHRWPAEKLDQLARCGVASEGAEIELPVRSRAARIGQLARLPAALTRNVARQTSEMLMREHWRIGVIEQPIGKVVEAFDPAAIQWLDLPFEGFLADPFGIAGPDGGLIILAEALPWKERRGRIAAIERRRNGALALAPTSLTHDTHLSYPQLIEHEGDIYCLPEGCARHRVQLFRALEFPGRWAPDTVLLEGFAGADATVIRYRERWWMFAGDHADQDEAKLFVFHAADLHGPWMPHARNPVKCDLRSSRSAGTPFIGEDGALYRPAQDCSRVYGGAVAVNRVSRLTPDEFEEEIAAYLRPDLDGPCPDGMHTLSAAGGRTLVDGKRHEPLTARMAAALSRRRRDPAPAASRHGQNRLR